MKPLRIVLALIFLALGIPSAVASPNYTFPVQGCKVTYAHSHHNYPATDILAPRGCLFVAPTSGVIDEVNKVDRFKWATELGPYPPKQPFYISHKDSSLLPMAGLFEYWKDPETGQMITSASIITRESVGSIATIHHRMPVMLPKDRWSMWLGTTSLSEAQVPEYLDLLETPDAEAGLQFYPVAPLVNNARNSGQELSAPITLGEPETLF